MVKPARMLASLDGLSVSEGTRTRLKKNFATVDDVVRCGRITAYGQGDSTDSPKWKSELVETLKEMGFIRPRTDFAKTFHVGALYSAIYGNAKGEFLTRINQLSNEQYENFVGLSDEDIKSVLDSLCERLSSSEERLSSSEERLSSSKKRLPSSKVFEVVCRHFGLRSDKRENLESIAQHFGTTKENVRKIEARALNKLRYFNTLPVLFDAPSEYSESVGKLMHELDELHKDPIFVKEREILAELRGMGRVPVRYFDETGKRLNLNGLIDSSPIESLELNPRTRNCLKRIGINTVSDIVRCPECVWRRFRSLTLSGFKEVVARMRSAGYEDFSIDI